MASEDRQGQADHMLDFELLNETRPCLNPLPMVLTKFAHSWNDTRLMARRLPLLPARFSALLSATTTFGSPVDTRDQDELAPDDVRMFRLAVARSPLAVGKSVTIEFVCQYSLHCLASTLWERVKLSPTW